MGAQFQLYVNTQLSKWEAYQDIMAHVGVGLNVFIHRHNAKVTLEYRNRPIFNANGQVAEPKGQLVRPPDAPVHLAITRPNTEGDSSKRDCPLFRLRLA